MNRNHFQLVMLAYNLNCWLLLFNRETTATRESLQHTTLATARLRFLGNLRLTSSIFRKRDSEKGENQDGK